MKEVSNTQTYVMLNVIISCTQKILMWCIISNKIKETLSEIGIFSGYLLQFQNFCLSFVLIYGSYTGLTQVKIYVDWKLQIDFTLKLFLHNLKYSFECNTLKTSCFYCRKPFCKTIKQSCICLWHTYSTSVFAGASKDYFEGISKRNFQMKSYRIQN